MMKLHIIYLTLWSVTSAAYVSRMTMNRQGGRPTALRPGVMLQRPWTHQRVVQAPHRAPYMVYRNQPHRYAVKHYNHPSRNAFPAHWKTTRPPPVSAVTTEYNFVRAASAPQRIRSDGGTGAIHTIPAPNLSLSEKPIVVIEADSITSSATSEAPKPTYEVTEKYRDHSVYQVAKIEQPIGFSKATSLSTPELQALVRNGAALQLASELGLSAIALPQHYNVQQSVVPQSFAHHQPSIQPSYPHQHPHQHVSHQHVPYQHVSHQHVPQQHIVSHQQIVPQHFVHQQQLIPQQSVPVPQSILPQQFTMQGFQTISNQQDVLQSSPEGIVISPNALYQPDPAFLQKLQNQLVQRFPGVEFIPYSAEAPPAQGQSQPSQNQEVPPLFLLENEQFIKQPPSSFVTSDTQNRNVVQRETQEGTVVTLVPQIVTSNVTENNVEVTSASEPQNITIELVAQESQPVPSTIKYIAETTTEEEKTTPIYYAQVGQSVNNDIANGFFSAINDVRAAAVMAQVEKPQEQTQAPENTTTTTTTTINPDLKPYFVQKPETDDKNQTTNEIKPLLGVPFAKQPDSVKVAYTLLRADDKEAKLTKDGNIYAGQIVEATISEDHDFNKQQANILSRRAPIRLFSGREKKETNTTTDVPQKMTVVKAKIPPKSKLTFDDKTGEPVLRIYASYVDSPMHKEMIASKLASAKRVKEVVTRKQDTVENWKAATLKSVDKTQGFDANQVTQFGLKLRSRSDDYVPLFEDYEE